eukprot:21121-Pelagococcus_subviridis.AAC.15
MRSSPIILAAVRSARSGGNPSSVPSSSILMLLYSLLALSRLCSLIARVTTVSPSSPTVR